MRLDLIGRDGSKVAYAMIDGNGASYAADESKQVSPPLLADTIFAVFFNNRLYAINLQTGAVPTRLTIYREKANESVQSKLLTLNLGEAEVPRYIVDLGAASGSTYQYTMYPEDDNMVYAGTLGSRVDDGESAIEGVVPCDALIVSRWSDTHESYVAERIFYFDANVSPQPYNNNAVVQKNQTFGRYFHIQHGATNVLSGQLNGMIGYVDCSTGRFVSHWDEEDALRWLTTDDTTKFYKNARGYMLPVDITSAITFTPDAKYRTSTASFEWTERSIPHTAMVIGVIE